MAHLQYPTNSWRVLTELAVLGYLENGVLIGRLDAFGRGPGVLLRMTVGELDADAFFLRAHG